MNAITKDKKLLSFLVVVVAVAATLALLAPFTMAQTPTPPAVCPPTPEPTCPCTVGEVTGWAGSSPPPCYLMADGSSHSRTEYAALYSVIGTTYGSANSSSFYLPNLRGKFLLGVGNGHSLATTGGTETVAL